MKKLPVVALVAFLAACSGRDGKKTDSALASDLALASQVQPAQPQFRDTAPSAAAPTGRAPSRIDNAPRTRPVNRPAATQAGAPAEAARTIPAGSTFSLSSQQKICTSSNRPGDRFVATLTNPVTGANGAVIPAGSSVVLEVETASPGNNGAGATLGIRVHSVEFNGMSYPLSGDVYATSELERTRMMSDPNSDKKKVIGGAVAGAIIGQIIGKSTKGTVIGAAAGGAAGAVAAKATEKYEGCMPVGGAMRLTLAQGITL